MKFIEEWQEGKIEYDLGNGFTLKRADNKEFGIHHAIYSKVDLELRFSWRKQVEDASNNENQFWMLKDGVRIGGVVIKPNALGYLFVEPPYEVDKFKVICRLNDVLISWSDKGKDIRVFGVMPEDIDCYQRLGYKIGNARRVMIRPTESFLNIDWKGDYIIKTPTLDDAPQIAELFKESYRGGADYEAFGEPALEKVVEDVKRIINIYMSNNILEGSTLVYDRESGELIGACIAGISGFCDNDFSEIGEIAVKPSHRGRGLAENMLRRALTNLNKISPATILCVTIGNTAEALYEKIGFFSGVKFTTMYR